MSRKKKVLVLIGFALAVSFLIALIPKTNIANVSAKQFTGLNHPEGVAIGDLYNDGHNELVIADRDNNRVLVYASNGTILKQFDDSYPPTGVAIGDYDNDGQNEIAITDHPSVGGIGNVTVYESDFTTIVKHWVVPNPFGVAIGDYDNDGQNELVFSNDYGYWTANVTVYKSDGTTVVKQWTGLQSARGVAIGDYNNDGRNEIAIVEEGFPYSGKVTVYENDGVTIVKQWTGLWASEWVAIGDYDNNGLNELAFSERYANRVTVYKSDGTIDKQWTGVSGAHGVAIGDYNNDGLNDIAFAAEFAGTATVYYQTEPSTVARVAEPTIVTLRGTLTNASGYPIQSGSIRVTVKDSMGTQVWQDTFDNCIDNGRYNLPLGTKTTLMLVKGQIYNAILEVDVGSATFVSATVTYGDNNPPGDIIRFVAN